MNKKSIYSGSYEMKPEDKKEILEELRGRKANENRARKLGILLKEEKSTTQELKRKVRTLEGENRHLKEVINQHIREEQARRSRKGEPR